MSKSGETSSVAPRCRVGEEESIPLVKTFLECKDNTTAIDINPYYLPPKMPQYRLQKIMDEYVAGVSTWYKTNAKMFGIAERKFSMIKEDSLKMRAVDLHALLRACENYHRIVAAEAHMRHIQFHEETRYPGCDYQMDHLDLDEKNWRVSVNSKLNAKTGEWTMRKVPYV